MIYYTHADCLLHEMGRSHPESPERLRSIDRQIKKSEIASQIKFQTEVPYADDEAIILVHPRSFLERIRAVSPITGSSDLDPDTSMNPYSLRAALRAAGMAVAAVDAVMTGQDDKAFCALRPPGHHAESARAMGFCIFNHVAIAARYALAKYEIKRVLIIDFDVHHGNGTEEIFKDDDRIMLCSSFQFPFYPYSDLKQVGSNPHIVKTPLAAGSDGSVIRETVEREWDQKIREFHPDLILVSAGFDAHVDDPLGGLHWQDEDYTWWGRQIAKWATGSAGKRVISFLEGGYEIEALGRSVVAYLSGIMH